VARIAQELRDRAASIGGIGIPGLASPQPNNLRQARRPHTRRPLPNQISPNFLSL